MGWGRVGEVGVVFHMNSLAYVVACGGSNAFKERCLVIFSDCKHSC